MKLISDSLIYALGAGVGRLLALAALPFLTAKLTPEQYGIIAMLTMFGMFLCAILGMGLGTSIGELYFSRQEEDFRGRVIASGWFAVASTHMMAIGLVWLSSARVSEWLVGDKKLASVTALMIVAQLIQHMTFPLQIKMQFEGRAKRATLASVSSAFATTGITLWLVVMADRGLMGYVQASMVGAILQLGIHALLAKVPIRVVDQAIMWKLIRSGWPMVFSFLMLFVIQQGVRLPLSWFTGMDSVGVFQIGFSLAAPFGMITSSFINAWTPFALNLANKREIAETRLPHIIRLYVMVMGFLVVLGVVFAPLLVRLLTAEAYHEAWQVLGMGLIWHFYLSVFLMLLPPVYFTGEVARAVVSVQTVTAIAFVLMAVIMVHGLGLAGAGLSMALAGGMLVSGQLLWNRRKEVQSNLRLRLHVSTCATLFLVGAFGAGELLAAREFGEEFLMVAGMVSLFFFFLNAWLGIGGMDGWKRIYAMMKVEE